MCVRNVFVLVFLCCVNSQAQWGQNPSNGFHPEYPGFPPETMAPPFHSPGYPDMYPKRPPPPPGHIPEDPYGHGYGQPQYVQPPGILDDSSHQNMHPKRPPPPSDFDHIPPPGFPDNSNHPHMHPHIPPPGLSDNSNHHDMHPHRPPPVILEFPYDQDWDEHPLPDSMDQLSDDVTPSDSQHKMEYAGQPRNLEVSYLKLEHADHELQFNVSWAPAMKGVASEYTLEIRSANDTNNNQSTNCNAHCYEFSIPGNVTSILIPMAASTVEKTCTLRPGCSYIARLIPHPWDGYTSAKVPVNLKDCEAGVCTCTHRSLLPVPMVHTETVIKEGMMYSNISWSLPPLNNSNGLPDNLRKLIYIVSLSERVSVSYRNEIYQYTVIRNVTADRGSLVSDGDTTRWLLLPLSKEGGAPIPTVKILAKVSLEDERECIGTAGNATAFDPDSFREAFPPTKSKFSFGVYAILGALIGAWAMGAVFVLSARVVKRVLKSFRPAPVSAPLEPLRRRPAWFPLQLRT